MFREQPQAFVSTPFGQKTTPAGDVDFDPIREKIVEALQSLGVQASSVDAGQPHLDESSLEAIRGSDFVIADVSGSNPYVMFEVGMAIALGKPLMLIAMSRSSSDLPVDIRSRQVAVYSAGDLSSVGRFVELMVRDVLAEHGTDSVATR